MEMEDGCINHQLQLPPGFRFCPTDEELVLHFLYPKALLLPNCHPNIIPQLDLHQLHLHPWELHGKALLSENQYFFFSQMIGNRIQLGNGYWKQLDTEEPIFSSGKKIGVKKLFVFFIGDGVETNWLMQEYHLCNWGSSALTSYYKTKGNQNLGSGKWVLCKVEESKGNINEQRFSNNDEDDGTELSCLDEMFLSMDDDFDDITSSNFW